MAKALCVDSWSRQQQESNQRIYSKINEMRAWMGMPLVEVPSFEVPSYETKKEEPDYLQSMRKSCERAAEIVERMKRWPTRSQDCNVVESWEVKLSRESMVEGDTTVISQCDPLVLNRDQYPGKLKKLVVEDSTGEFSEIDGTDECQSTSLLFERSGEEVANLFDPCNTSGEAANSMGLEVGGEASAAQSGLFHSEIPKSQSTVVNETPKLQSVVANSRREFFGIPTNVNSSLRVIFESQEWGGSIAEDSDCESREVNLPPSNVWTDSQIESIATKGSELKIFPCEDHELSQTVVEEDSTEVDYGGLVEDQVQDDIPWDSNLDQYPTKMKIRTGMDDLEKTIGAYYVFDKMSSREIALPQFSTTLKIADFISANGIQCCFFYVAIGKDLVFTHACGMVIFDPGGVFTLFVTEIRQMTSFLSEVEVTREAEFFSLRWQWDPGGMACLLVSLLRAAFSVFGGSGTSASMKTVQVLGIG